MIRVLMLSSVLLAGAAGEARPIRSVPVPGAAPPARAPERQHLPFSHGRTFATLDQYLEHLRRYAGPVGQPWYRRIGPGVYERVTTMMPPPPRRTFTRAQLLRQFGFAR